MTLSPPCLPTPPNPLFPNSEVPEAPETNFEAEKQQRDSVFKTSMDALLKDTDKQIEQAQKQALDSFAESLPCSIIAFASVSESASACCALASCSSSAL